MINRYELSSPKMAEEIVIEYTNGELTALILPVRSPLGIKAFYKLLNGIQYFEKDIALYSEINLTATPAMPSNKKITLWCEKWMEYHGGIKYTASGNDGKVISPYKVTPEILDTYFKSENFLIRDKHGVFNFTKYYNLVIDELKNPNRSKHPNHYSKEYADKLSDDGRKDYWAHLRSLNLEPKKNSVGALMDWIKKV